MKSRLISYLSIIMLVGQFASAIDIIPNVPRQLVGNCLENNGSGLLENNQAYGGTRYKYTCTVPVVTDKEIENSHFRGHQPDDFWLLTDKHELRPVRPAYTYGHVRWGIVRFTAGEKALALVLTLQCEPYRLEVCSVDGVLKSANKLGNFEGYEVLVVFPPNSPLPPTPGHTPDPPCTGAACYGGG